MFLFVLQMKEDDYIDLEVGKLCEEDKFKKIKISHDSTDAMSEFLDK